MPWTTTMEVMQSVRFVSLLCTLIFYPLTVSADLEDSFNNARDPRNPDLQRLVRSIRDLQSRGALPPELADLVSRLDSTSDVIALRQRLIALLPDVARQDFHKDRRQPIRATRIQNQNQNRGQPPTPASNWGGVLWLDSNADLAPRTDVWVQTWSNDSEQEDDIFEYTADSTGWTFGIDRELTDRWLLSASVGSEDADIDSSIFGRDEVDSQSASVSLSYIQGRHSFSFGWLRTDAETDRVRVLFVPTDGGIRRFPLQSDFDTQQDAVQITYGTYFTVSESFSIAPFLSASYAWLETDDYVERGGDSLSLIVETGGEEQILGSAGVTFSWQHIGNTWSFAPALTALVEHDCKSEITTTLSRFTGTDARFVTTGHDLSETRWRGAASVTALYRDRASFSLSYEAHVRDDYDYDGVILTAQIRVD